MWHKYWVPWAWSGWEDFGGSFKGDPGVVSWGAGRLDVFGLGGDDDVSHRWYDGGWSPGWGRLDGGARRGTFAAEAGRRYRVRVDLGEPAGSPGSRLDLRWTPPGGVEATVPGEHLGPRYGLVTSTVTEDAGGAGTETTTTTYPEPANGLPGAVTRDPAGLALATTTTYEAPGAGWLRPTARTLPAGDTTAYEHYAADATAEDPCTEGPQVYPQGGLAKKTTEADPDGAGPGVSRSTEVVYDPAGRVVASRVNSEGWSCVGYDTRGRLSTRTVPAYGARPARSVAYDHAVGGNPFVTSVTDVAGTVSTTVDLLGRVVAYRDVWGDVTTSTYDRAGRLTARNGPLGAEAFTYDPAGRLLSESLDGVTLATVAYDTAGELVSVAYPANNTALAALTRDPVGRVTGVTWALAGGVTLTDTVSRSQAGRVVDESVDGTDADPTGPNFAYDAVGRLSAARVPGHTLAYGYTDQGAGCPGVGAIPSGRNTNRTFLTDNTVTTSYCYDHADRLTATTDSTVGTPAYDTHGNTTTLGAGAGTHTLGYDSSDRHTTTVNGAVTVTYTRDATDRTVARAATGEPTVRYGHTGAGDTPDLTLDSNNNVTERVVGLPGGVTLTERGGNTAVWSYPNVHGDTLAVADHTGTKQGPTLAYDPYGQALGGIPDNSAGNLDYAWLGRHQRGTEHATSLPVVEMGARPYLPNLGRFTQVDPVQGGCANPYTYVFGDPVNTFDISGQQVCRRSKVKWRRKGRSVAYGRLEYAGGSTLRVRARPAFGVFGRFVGRREDGSMRIRGGTPFGWTTLTWGDPKMKFPIGGGDTRWRFSVSFRPDDGIYSGPKGEGMLPPDAFHFILYESVAVCVQFAGSRRR